MLESTQAVDDGAEEPEKDQRTILIPRMILAQVAIACLVSLRPHEVQPFDQTLQRLEILQAVNVFRAYLAASCCHGSHYGNFEPRAQLGPPSLDSLASLAQISCRTLLERSSFLSSPWPRVFNLWSRCRGHGQVENLPPRGAAHPVPNRSGTQLFSRSAEVPKVSDSRAVRLQIAVPLPYN